ncbi:Spore photoproduct lyase [bioreactor metagenome]|uniref:Spore photoproduct lyase n=1 Tax=bioreactor metagenome TaxID=1076179 RepID=A0A645I927_9ZZZZ
MNDEERKFKYGQFGYGKYVYSNESMEDIKQFFNDELNNLYENIEIKYII